jgi:hypothetical protein
MRNMLSGGEERRRMCSAVSGRKGIYREEKMSGKREFVEKRGELSVQKRKGMC